MTPTARQLVDATQSEADYQEQIVQLAELSGCWVYHHHDSRRSNPGFPDLMILRSPDLWLWELKTEKGRVRPEQHMVINALKEVKYIHAAIVRPSDWPMVEAVLKAKR